MLQVEISKTSIPMTSENSSPKKWSLSLFGHRGADDSKSIISFRNSEVQPFHGKKFKNVENFSRKQSLNQPVWEAPINFLNCRIDIKLEK